MPKEGDMRRTVYGWILAIGALAPAQPVYVPGQYTEEGIYIRPHFKSSDTRLDEGWFKDPVDPLAGKKDEKLTPPEAASSKDLRGSVR
jgi:hypothetical protein